MTSPIIIDPVSVTQTGILRPLYRRALGEQLGGCKVYHATATASSAEARRLVISTSLRDEEWGRDRLKGRWLYVTDGAEIGHQGRILRSGFYGAGGITEITPPFSAILQDGSEFEVSWPLPSEQYLDVKGLNQLVNEALARCTIESRLTLPGNGTRSHSLLDYEAYLDQEDRIDAVYDSWGVATGDPTERPYYPIRVDTTNSTRTLITGYAYSSGQSFDVRVLRAGHTLVHDGISWQTTTAGLTSDSHAAAVPIPWVVAFGMVKALQAVVKMIREDQMLTLAEKREQIADLVPERRQWARAANRIAMTQFPMPTPPLRDSMVGLGFGSPLPLSVPS